MFEYLCVLGLLFVCACVCVGDGAKEAPVYSVYYGVTFHCPETR